MITNLLYLTLIIVFIIDYSGVIEHIETLMTKLFKSKFQLHIPRPFSCSLCMTFWSGLTYLIINNNFTLPLIAYVCLLSALTSVIIDVTNVIINNIRKILTRIY